MSEDPLEMYYVEIAHAELAELPSYMDDKTTVGEAKNMAIRDLAAALRAERERVAELEPDAKLGRMVREMPVEQRLIHTVYGDWWYGRNVRGEFGATGASPEAVLEAARKEIP
jgi:hypothetical protein